MEDFVEVAVPGVAVNKNRTNYRVIIASDRLARSEIVPRHGLTIFRVGGNLSQCPNATPVSHPASEKMP